jgi:hypothetical protein
MANNTTSDIMTTTANPQLAFAKEAQISRGLAASTTCMANRIRDTVANKKSSGAIISSKNWPVCQTF